MYTMKDFMEKDFMENPSLLDKYMEDMGLSSETDRKVNKEFILWCKRIYSMVDMVKQEQADGFYKYFILGMEKYFDKYRESLYKIWGSSVERLEIALRVMVNCRLTSLNCFEGYGEL